MQPRHFALVIGILFLVVGVLGFVPALVQPPPAGAPEVAVHANHGYLLGLFPINLLHNLVHLAVGALGLAAYFGALSARLYARGLAIFYGLLAIMGMIPGANTTFGLIPIHGNDIWLHAGTAVVAAYFGWVARDIGATAPGHPARDAV
jgi:hypothetical protein